MATGEKPSIDILVAEENQDVRKAVVGFLDYGLSRHADASFFSTGSGREALRAIGERNFDVVIVSERLPGNNLGTDIISVIMELYAQLPRQPPAFLVLVTEPHRYRYEAARLGVPILEKPFKYSDLIRLVMSAYAQRAAATN